MSVFEDLYLIRSTFSPDEFRWIGDADEVHRWEENFSGHSSSYSDSEDILDHVKFALVLSRSDESVLEAVIELQPATYIAISITGTSDRDWQAHLNAIAKAFLESHRDPEQRLYAAIMRLVEEQEQRHAVLSAHGSLLDQNHLSSAGVTAIERTSSQVSRVFLWAHHLLATSKRKSITEWCDELHLWGISRPGYPGIILVEGEASNVQEFVQRTKRLQWQALQVRYEDTEDLNGLLQSEVEKIGGAIRTTHLRSKPGAVEVETVAEVASLMRQANLEDVFLSSMKIRH